MRRRLAAVAAFGLLLAAAPASPGPRLPLEFWTIALQPLLTAYVQDMIGRYERAHPGARVRWIDLQFQSLDQKLLSAIAGGVAPDVVNLNTEITVRMAQAHALVDMEAADPAHAGLLARYVDLFKRDMFPADTLQRGYLGATERYAAGQLAMLVTGPEFLLRVRSDGPDAYRETLVAPAPLGRGRVLDLPTMDLAVPLASRHPAEAVDFALFVTNDENQFGFSHVVAAFPSTVAAAADPYFTRGGTTPEARGRAIAAQELGIARDLTVVTPRSDELLRIFREAVENAFFGRMTPQEALSWAAAEWNRRL